jgi:anti-anti-sigma factor
MYKIQHEDGPGEAVRILVARGELDGASSREIRKRVEDALAAGKRCVVVDLSEASYMESAAVTALVDGNARVARFGAALKIVIPTDSNVRRIFSVARLDTVLHLYDTREDALGAA